MDAQILKLNGLLSKKETATYSITGTTSDGTFRCLVEPEAKFKENVTHYVYLKSFTGWSYFPNLDESNNKFIYSTIDATGKKWESKQFSINIGAYQISDYNDVVQSNMLLKGDKDEKDEPAIKIYPYIPTSRIMIKIAKGYKVHFTKGTWFKELGFDENQILEEGLHTAPNRADLMKTLKIRIECNICNGFKINRGNYMSSANSKALTYSNVLYEFPNNAAAGESISFNPNPVIYTTLRQKSFNEIVLKFSDDDGKPVNFQEEEWNCLIYIIQN